MSARHAILGVVALCAGIGCSGADEHPLGGPYGGSGSDTPPTSGGVSPSGANEDGGPTGTIGGGTTGGTGASADAGSGGTGGGTTDAGGGTGTGGAVDGGPVTPPPAAPTWSQIYASYLSVSSKGECARSGCHSQMSTAAGAYAWLTRTGDIRGTASKLANPKLSRLSWFGGSMPPGGPGTWPEAERDFPAWGAAGALEN